MKKTSLLVASALLASSALFAQDSVTSNVVGYTTSTLAGGAGNIYAPAFVNSPSLSGTLASVSGTSVTISGASMATNEYAETSDVAFVSKGYPQYYLEVTNDTNASDGLDTEGAIIDIVSNTGTDLVLASDASVLGVQGDESVVIRRHVTLGSTLGSATGLLAYATPITIYNEDGPGTSFTHIPDGAGGFLSGADFATNTSDAPIYPGTGVVINNSSSVSVTATGTVKESATQVQIYGGSNVNVISFLTPVQSHDYATDGQLQAALADYTDVVTHYTTDGTLAPAASSLDDGFSGFVSAVDFFTPMASTVDGTSEAVVINAASASVFKISGNVIN
jgi:hypothetical protein